MIGKMVIAGSRGISQYGHLMSAIRYANSHHAFFPSVILSGDCPKGVDQLGIRFATEFKLPIEHYPANWNKNGIMAGYMRNIEMAKVADAGIIIWDGLSKGTNHMITQMRRLGKPLLVYRLDLKDTVKFGRKEVRFYSHVETIFSTSMTQLKVTKPKLENAIHF